MWAKVEQRAQISGPIPRNGASSARHRRRVRGPERLLERGEPVYGRNEGNGEGEFTMPIDPLMWRNPHTFFAAPRIERLEELNADVALIGIPYDAGTLVPLFRTGQSRGPALARESATQISSSLDPEAASGWFDIEDGKEHLVGVKMSDCGDVAISGGQIQENLDRISDVAARIVQREALLVSVGGDHSVSFPLARGMQRFGSIDIVHFDAHADFADSVHGSRYAHACGLRRTSELPFVHNISAIGLRNVWKSEYDDLVGYGANIVTSRQLLETGSSIVQDAVPEAANLYVTIDIDVLDSSIVPGTTTPEPGGLTYRLLRDALVAVSRKGRVVGFDVVELNPYDPTGATARVTSWIITHFLAAIFDAKGGSFTRG